MTYDALQNDDEDIDNHNEIAADPSGSVGDDFDDFEAGNVDDEFGDFDDDFQQAEEPSEVQAGPKQSEALKSALPSISPFVSRAFANSVYILKCAL